MKLGVRPKDLAAHVGLGQALRRKGDREGAVAEFEAAALLDPAPAKDEVRSAESDDSIRERARSPIPWARPRPVAEPARPADAH